MTPIEKAQEKLSIKATRNMCLRASICPDCGSDLEIDFSGNFVWGICKTCPPCTVTRKFLWYTWQTIHDKVFILG